ncbi:hypothetical protein E2C01_049518 [Portunus trituberculatus]|uniref:Uncharacterized protein n=1 Tax=Portunus trituberculatus TaxID=210409 RepID=A0A5B7GDD1_PORTR|nr:hypothetical protein [Portunus trituberculatus]
MTRVLVDGRVHAAAPVARWSSRRHATPTTEMFLLSLVFASSSSHAFSVDLAAARRDKGDWSNLPTEICCSLEASRVELLVWPTRKDEY